MRGTCALRTPKGWVFWFFLAAAVGALTACSTDDATKRPRTAKLNRQTLGSDRPYERVNLTCPITMVYNPQVYIYKGDKRLLLVQDKTLIREYRIALGPHPSGDKYFRGDGRTPEGELFVCFKNPESKFYKSCGLNYPTPKHAQEAYLNGSISTDEYRSILDANECMTLPPGSTPLGGDIFIHGGGAYRNWTEGCIAVNNSDMDELFEVLRVGTPVQILP